MIEGLRGIRLPVANLELARAWYAALLDTQPFAADGSSCMLAVAGGSLELVEAAAAQRAIGMEGTPPVAGNGPGPVAYWGVDHLGLELARLAEHGIRPIEPPRAVDPATQVALFRDPSGHVVALMERIDPRERRARSQRVAEKVALRNVRGKVDELVLEQRQLERFGSLVIRVLGIVVLVLAVAFLAWRSARAADWLDSPEAKQFRDRVVLLALIYGESNGIDPQGYMVRTRLVRKLDAHCGEVEVVFLLGEKEVRRESARACKEPPG